MAEDKPTFPTRRPHHVGVVVKDIDKAIAQMEALGFGPFMFDESTGRSRSTSKASCMASRPSGPPGSATPRWATSSLSFWSRSPGDQALRESLDAQGEGLHHIGWLTTDLQGDIERAKARGAKIWCSSIVPGQPGFGYFEGSAIGNLAIELREP